MWEQIKEYLIYFVVGGAVTAAIVGLEKTGSRLLSGLATLVPVFTLIAYYFIGEARGGVAVSQHAWLVLFGTLVSWVPYMIVVAVLAPRLGPSKAIPTGLVVFSVLAVAYLQTVRHFGWFR
ncbi:MAG: GlpM family protein [Patescibacteria group bacterium]|nr:GlpM family protein [Patescibacteria group bacterium]